MQQPCRLSVIGLALLWLALASSSAAVAKDFRVYFGTYTIAAFAIDAKTGKLTLVGHQNTGGKIPRSFGIDPTGRWLLAANQHSDNVVVLRIDEKSGALAPTGQQVQVGAPVCVKFGETK